MKKNIVELKKVGKNGSALYINGVRIVSGFKQLDYGILLAFEALCNKK